MNFFVAIAFALGAELLGAFLTAGSANARAEEVNEAKAAEVRLKNQLSAMRDVESKRVLMVKTRSALHSSINQQAVRGLDTESGFTQAGNKIFISELENALKYLGDTGALKGKIADSQLKLFEAQNATPDAFEVAGAHVLGLASTIGGGIAGAKYSKPDFSFSDEWDKL
jgi:hypothetical protein